MKKKTVISGILFPLLIITLTFLSCSIDKRACKYNEDSHKTELLFSSYNVSPRTKLFLKELNKELKVGSKSLKTFVPSEIFIKKYDIKKIDSIYAIGGLIKTSESFNKNSFDNSGIIFGQTSGRITTVFVPIYYLNDFLNKKEIEYFEISEKVYSK